MWKSNKILEWANMKQIFSVIGITLALLATTALSAYSPATSSSSLSPQEAHKIAVDAYIYGYSLVTSEITRFAFTNTEKPQPETLQAPLNQIVNQTLYPPAKYKGVTAPNADTLYSVGFINVRQEPMVFSYPDMGTRYFLFPIYDEWTEILAAPGSRTAGGKAKNVLITGPSWTGDVPKDMMKIQSPTNILFIIGRVYSDGTAKDIDEVHALQKQFTLVPLSKFGQPYTPPPGKSGGKYTPKEIVRNVINAMSTADYFNMMANAMKLSPPVLPQDEAIVERMAKIGLVPGQSFKMNQLSAAVQKALEDVGKIGYSKIDAEQKKEGKLVHGWHIPGVAGTYGTNYLDRAAISAFGWGANLPNDAVYPFTKVDSTGEILQGNNVYKIHFDKGQTPPVQGFWSITMYDDQFYFYPNSLDKLTISPRNKLKYNDDGSLDLYFSNQQPKDIPQSNWLPAPSANFILMMRMYWPKTTSPSILPPSDPSWLPPPVIKMNEFGLVK
jgi:hypothetical protein